MVYAVLAHLTQNYSFEVGIHFVTLQALCGECTIDAKDLVNFNSYYCHHNVTPF